MCLSGLIRSDYCPTEVNGHSVFEWFCRTQLLVAKRRFRLITLLAGNVFVYHSLNRKKKPAQGECQKNADRSNSEREENEQFLPSGEMAHDESLVKNYNRILRSKMQFFNRLLCYPAYAKLHKYEGFKFIFRNAKRPLCFLVHLSHFFIPPPADEISTSSSGG